MVKPKVKSVAAPKVASYPAKTSTIKTAGKSQKPARKPGSKLQKKSSGNLKTSKTPKTAKEIKDKENSTKTVTQKKVKKFLFVLR